MIVEDIFTYVKYGDLANIGLTDRLKSTDPNVKATAEEQLISYINLGLIELYKRFLISVEAEVIKTHPLVKVYTLRNNKIARILDVYDSEGKSLKFPHVVNVESCDIRELGNRVYMLTNPKDEEIVFTYQGLHPTIKNKNNNLDIPEVALEALLNYIGNKAYATIGGSKQQDQLMYLNKYEESCKVLEQEGYFKGNDLLSKNVIEKGFV